MGFLRVIAGEFRGRRIAVPVGQEVRPTADRVREALFDILGESVRDARILDAYAGSGALGIEALSRGARQVVFLESSRRVGKVLRGNLARLGLEPRSTALSGRTVDLIREGRLRGPFEIVLADPPYEAGEIATFVPAVAGLVAEGGLLIVEHEARSGLALPRVAGLRHTRTATYGRCSLEFFRSDRRGGGGS